MRIFIISALLIIGACTIRNNTYNDDLQKWIGQPEFELYKQWGTPNDVFYISNSRKIITFTRIYKKQHLNAYSNEINYNAINSGYQSDNNAYPDYCRTSFTITNGVISDYTFSGDYCVSNTW